MTSAVRRHTPTGIPARLARHALTAVALCVAGLAVVWVVTAANNGHQHRTRSERAAKLMELTRLTAQERQLVSAGPSQARSQRIAQASRQIVGILEDLSNDIDADGSVKALASTYGSAISAASAPGQAARSRWALGHVQATATRALAALQTAALREPSGNRPLGVVEAVSAALVVIAGSLVLVWIASGRPKRRRDSGYEARFQVLAAEARTDNLTKLGNHRAFQDDLTTAIAQRTANAQPFTLMAIDLDGLKRINDTKGHPAGDAHIKKVAECLKAVIRDTGTVYRTGGDEFMVLLPGRRAWHALTVAAKIEQATSTATGGRAVSIGVTESVSTEGRHLLVHQADVALYEAKRTRLNAVAYHPGLGAPHDARTGEGPSQDQRRLAAALARAVDAKDFATRSHSETVAQLCVAIGERLNIHSIELERLRLAGLLHDVGKIGVADMILQKPGALDADEQTAMTEHVEIGHAILLGAELPIEANWVLHHHEWYDGTGYPERMRGSAIPLQSRIISVADAFEAMTGIRPYSKGVSIDHAVAELQRQAGSQFDPRCVTALVDVIRDAGGEDKEDVLDALAKGTERSVRKSTTAAAAAVNVNPA
jgi:diguanylate cyclase (GGDEF)-like protein